MQYEGILAPNPFDIILMGQLPVCDEGKELGLADMQVPIEMRRKSKYQNLFEHITYHFFKRDIPRQVEFDFWSIWKGM